MKHIRNSIILFVALLSFNNLDAQTEELNKYKSLFTFNFVRYIGWPPASKHGDFVIGVVKNPGIANNLKSITATKKFGYQNIVIKEFKKIEEITNCQILYISSTANYSKNHALFAEKLMNKNSLIITESNGAINKGSMINFVIKENKLKFEISASNAKRFGLDFSNSLMTMNNAIKM